MKKPDISRRRPERCRLCLWQFRRDHPSRTPGLPGLRSATHIENIENNRKRPPAAAERRGIFCVTWGLPVTLSGKPVGGGGDLTHRMKEEAGGGALGLALPSSGLSVLVCRMGRSALDCHIHAPSQQSPSSHAPRVTLALSRPLPIASPQAHTLTTSCPDLSVCLTLTVSAPLGQLRASPSSAPAPLGPYCGSGTAEPPALAFAASAAWPQPTCSSPALLCAMCLRLQPHRPPWNWVRGGLLGATETMAPCPARLSGNHEDYK